MNAKIGQGRPSTPFSRAFFLFLTTLSPPFSSSVVTACVGQEPEQGAVVAVVASFWKTAEAANKKNIDSGGIFALLSASLSPFPSLFSTRHPVSGSSFPLPTRRLPSPRRPFRRSSNVRLALPHPPPSFFRPCLPINTHYPLPIDHYPDPWAFPAFSGSDAMPSLVSDLAIQTAQHAHISGLAISRSRGCGFVCRDISSLGVTHRRQRQP